MAAKKITELIIKGIREGFIHPGRDGAGPTPVVYSQFRTAGMPPELAELVDNSVEMFAECIVNAIENDGASEIIDRDELAQRQVAVDAGEANRIVTVHCRCDKTGSDPLAVLSVTDSPRVVIDGKQLLGALAAREVKCPHTRKPQP